MLINIIRNCYYYDNELYSHCSSSIYKTVDVPNKIAADQIISDLNKYSSDETFTYEEVKVSSIKSLAKEVYDREVCATVVISTNKNNPGVEVTYNIHEHKSKIKNYAPRIIKINEFSKDMYYEIRFNYYMTLECYLSMEKEKLDEFVIKEINRKFSSDFK